MRSGVSLLTKHQHHGRVFAHDNEYALVLKTKCECPALSSRKGGGAIQSSARETGHISTPRLHTLRCFHLEPINVVISHESHNDS